jgi:hypothetical protein
MGYSWRGNIARGRSVRVGKQAVSSLATRVSNYTTSSGAPREDKLNAVCGSE